MRRILPLVTIVLIASCGLNQNSLPNTCDFRVVDVVDTSVDSIDASVIDSVIDVPTVDTAVVVDTAIAVDATEARDSVDLVDATDSSIVETHIEISDASATDTNVTFTVQPGDVVRIFGDSLTAGGINGSCGTSVKWQANFAQLIVSKIGASAYTEGGASGATMREFAVDYGYLVDYKPTLVFIEFGINDVLSNRPPEATAADLGAGVIGSWAKSPKIRFVILPAIAAGERWEGFGAQDSKITATNAAMKAEVDRLSTVGSIVFLADVRKAWFAAVMQANPANDNKCHLQVDSLHFNDIGASAVSAAVAAHLQ